MSCGAKTGNIIHSWVCASCPALQGLILQVSHVPNQTFRAYQKFFYLGGISATAKQCAEHQFDLVLIDRIAAHNDRSPSQKLYVEGGTSVTTLCLKNIKVS